MWRSVRVVSGGAILGTVLSLFLSGQLHPNATPLFAVSCSIGVCFGDTAISRQSNWIHKALIYYASAAIGFWPAMPFLLFLPVHLSDIYPEYLIAGSTLLLLVLVVIHSRLPQGVVWVNDSEVEISSNSRWFWILAGIVSLAFVGWLDIIADPAFSPEFLYIVPVFAVTWATGRWGGITIAIVAANLYAFIASATRAEGAPVLPLLFNSILVTGGLIGAAIVLAWIRRLLHRERRSARQDGLTKLLNRTAFYEAVRAEAARAERRGPPFSLAYIDLDGFKAVNDTQGHDAGDSVLRCVAAVLSSRLRGVDAVARLGGDEFAVLLANTDETSARQVLVGLQATLINAMVEHGWPVTFSIGAIAGVQTAHDVDRLIQRADLLMYAVKKSGKNQLRLESAHSNGGASDNNHALDVRPRSA